MPSYANEAITKALNANEGRESAITSETNANSPMMDAFPIQPLAWQVTA
jgi:hypothetical protein